MSELNFPKNPELGQEYLFNTMLYMFDGVKWVTKGTGYNSVQDLYEMLASDAGSAFIGTQHYDSVQSALDSLEDKDDTFSKASSDIFSATDSPFAPTGQSLKVVAGGGTTYPGRMFVLAGGGGGAGLVTRVFNGNVAAPSLPVDSENGSWALWRTGIVSALEYAWVYKKPTSFTGTWTEADVSFSAIDIFTDPNLGTLYALKVQRSSTGGAGAVATINVTVGHDGEIRMGFMGTASAPLAQKIVIDGVTAATVNLRTTTPAILTFVIKAVPGSRVVTIPHEEASTILNIIGANFLTLAQLQHWHTDISAWAAYTKSPNYVTNEGAADYAFKAKNGNSYWAGSYHGGEYERAAPEFSLDHRIITPSDSFIGIGRRFSILQQTQLRWASTLESLDMDSLTIFQDSGVFMQCAASNANLVAHTAFIGMNTTSHAFDSAIGARYHNAATTDGVHYAFGPCQQITQIERSTGRLVYTRFSRPPLLNNSYGGATISYATGAYAKAYSGFIRNAEQKLPVEFSFAFMRAFL